MSDEFRPRLFACPRCGASYKVVRAEAAGATNREIACLGCGGPLTGREGEFVLKYFLVEAPRRQRQHHQQRRSA